MIGWIKLHRSLLEWEWYSDHNTTRVLIHLLVSVNFEDKKWKGIECKAGSIITSYSKLSTDIGLSIQQVRTILKRLKINNQINIKSTNKFILISLIKWEELQDTNIKSTSKRVDKKQSNNNQITTTKESKEIKEDKEVIINPDLNEREQNFINWFNDSLEKHRGVQGKFKTMSKSDKSNLSKLQKEYTKITDWENAFSAMMKNPWVIENSKATVDHFLVNSNFQKYVNTLVISDKPKFKAPWS